MAQLTSQQATDLANNFLGLGQAIADYRYENWNTLSKEDRQKLEDLRLSILHYGADILALSTTLVMDDVQTSLTNINNVTTQIKGTIKNLQNIQKGINVAAAVATLGAAIISKNPQAIVNSITGVVNVWNA
jgi:hypothetical protein